MIVIRDNDHPARPARRRSALRWFGNLFIGISLGLLAYYGITGLVTRAAQSRLEGELGELGIAGSVEVPQRPVGEDPLDMRGIETDHAYWETLAEGDVFGRLVIDRMDLDVAVVKGTRSQDLRKGPGWIAYTDLPGSTGNCGISGHRTTYGAPFRRLDEIEPGDEIVLYSPSRRFTYEASDTIVVAPDRVDVLDGTEEPTLTLTACHPPYSARYRLVVRAKLVEVRRLERLDPLGTPDRTDG